MQNFYLKTMVKLEIVRKFMSWIGLVNTTASVKTSKSENFIKCTGLLGFEGLRKPKELRLMQKNAFRKAEIIIQEIKNEERKCNLAIVCDELNDTLYRIIDIARFIMSVHPKKKFGDVAKKVYSDSWQFLNRVYSDREFYYFLKKAAKDKNQVLEAEPFDIHMVDCFLNQLEDRYLLFDKMKKDMAKLKLKLSKYFDPATLGYFQNLTWHLTLFDAYESSDNLLFKLLCSRLELAEIKGFSTYGDLLLKARLAGTPDFVMQFLRNINKLIKTEIDRDLHDIIKDNKFRGKMEALKYLISKSMEKFVHSEYCINEYFSLDACMDGLKHILSSLYDIILEKIEDKDLLKGELWHSDVKKYCIRQGNEILGHIYLDFFARCNKPQGRFLIQTSRMCENGTYQIPVVVISFTFIKPPVSEPLLLNVYDVHNLFIQMGSVMHDILEQKKYRMFSRDRCASDLFQVPSFLMSFFASDSRVLQKFARHYQTREVMPDDIIEKVRNCENKYYFHQSQMMVFNSLVDQACYCVKPESFSLNKMFLDVRNEIFGTSEEPLTYAQEQECINLVHQSGASDYCSLMSRAVASLIWQKYFKNDPLSRTAGEQYRNKFLAKSSLLHARFLVESYLQMKLTPECLANAFVEQLLNPI